MAEINFTIQRVWDTIDAVVKVEVGYWYQNEKIKTNVFEYTAPFPTAGQINTDIQTYAQTLFDARKDSFAKVLELKAYVGMSDTVTVT